MSASPAPDLLSKIRTLEERWLNAHLNLDLLELEYLMHPDYQIVRPDGSIWNKSQALASYENDKRKWERAEISELSIRLYSSFALVTGIWRAKGENRSSQFDYRARYFSVWAKDVGDKWRMLHDQSLVLEEY